MLFLLVMVQAGNETIVSKRKLIKAQEFSIKSANSGEGERDLVPYQHKLLLGLMWTQFKSKLKGESGFLIDI